MSLREAFAPGGASIPAEDQSAFQSDPAWSDVERSIVERYWGQREKARIAKAEQRTRLFRCAGTEDAIALIAEVFKDPEVRRLRKELAPYAKFDNPLRRFTLERARVYAKPAKSRTVNNDTNDSYQELQRRTQHDRAMKAADQTLALQNDVYIQFRVRDTARGREPRIDVVGPDQFRAVSDTRDNTKLLAIIVSTFPDSGKGGARATDPHHVLWSDSEVMRLDKDGRIIRDTIAVNPFGRIPGVLIADEYRTDGLLDSDTGDDAVSAHLATWLVNTMLLKSSKSLGRQIVFTGETGQSPTGQSQDDERDMTAGEGVGITPVDRGVDPRRFIEVGDHITERAGSNRGIPPSVLRHAGATSGYEIDLRRIPLEELREDRIGVWRAAEREFADIESMVLGRDMPELEFDTDQWSIDFAEIRRPLPPDELYTVRRTKRAMGHSDPVIEAMEDNPDLDEDQAADWVGDRMQANAAFVLSSQMVTNMPAAADAENPGRTPEQNGADNDPDDDDDEQRLQ